MAKELQIPYKIKVGKGLVQTRYASEEKMREIRAAYDKSQINSYARFTGKGLDSFFIKADNIEQANRLMEMLLENIF